MMTTKRVEVEVMVIQRKMKMKTMLELKLFGTASDCWHFLHIQELCRKCFLPVEQD